jgi:hypothetical protein
MRKRAKRKCLYCGQRFEPDYRNHHHQKYCSQPLCRKASKASSQRRWLKKPDNRDYFRHPDHVERAQKWRKAHPRQGDGGGSPTQTSHLLQDVCSGQPCEIIAESAIIPPHPAPPVPPSPSSPPIPPLLQDFSNVQHIVLLGLIAHLTGALQDDIAITFRRFLQLGQDILYTAHSDQGGKNDRAAHLAPGPSTPGASPFQLGRPPPGAG